MAYMRPNQTITAKAIYFNNGTVLTDRTVFVADNFVIVAEGKEDESPTWYNAATIDRMEGVRKVDDQRRTARVSFF